ncbi:hypothetical protein [Streptomyces melanogenes]|uniref:hypothetical protein n=1 Tax=Streptomyces melanogenes TaxID=67326 RepID=UPI003795C381
MVDDLYARYMTAAATSRVHEASCTRCSLYARCDTGQRLHGALATLQDTYLARQKERRG